MCGSRWRERQVAARNLFEGCQQSGEAARSSVGWFHGESAGTGPIAVAFTPDGKTAYVVSLEVDTVISTATSTPGPPIKAGVHPYAIAIPVSWRAEDQDSR
jgi:hypothetical protein